MLTLGRIPVTRLKCPRHTQHQYVDEATLPPHCDCCRAIYQVLAAHADRERLQRTAEGMLDRAKLAQAGRL